MTAAMNGTIMIARINPALSMPMPIGGPSNRRPMSGMGPRCSVSHGCRCSENTGANTNSPHIP